MTGDLGFTRRQRKNGAVEILHGGRLASDHPRNPRNRR
jgi:hypothetical protein